MNNTVRSSPTIQFDRPTCDEREIVARLLQVVSRAGILADPSEIINVYVALKSKPMAILTGPAGSGKVALIQNLAHLLIGQESFHYQPMIGHAWWASGSPNVTLFTEAQTRLNDLKLLALVEKALQPDNVKNRVFIACLISISPAELIDFFSEIALQLHYGELTHLPSIHLDEPLPFPPNLLLIGTIDAARWKWSNMHLLSEATIIHWANGGVKPGSGDTGSIALPGSEREFLRNCIRKERPAYRKLESLAGWRSQTVGLLYQVACLLEANGVELPYLGVSEAIIYLANAWTKDGKGLFESDNNHNLAIALDYAIAQNLLNRGTTAISRSVALQMKLQQMLVGMFPRSTAVLRSLQVGQLKGEVRKRQQ